MEKLYLTPPTLDVHQHPWTEPLVEALERRREPPFARPAGPRAVPYSQGDHPATVETGERAAEVLLSAYTAGAAALPARSGALNGAAVAA